MLASIDLWTIFLKFFWHSALICSNVMSGFGFHVSCILMPPLECNEEENEKQILTKKILLKQPCNDGHVNLRSTKSNLF